MATLSWLGSGAPVAGVASAAAAMAYGAATVLQSVGVRRFAAAPRGSWALRFWAGRSYAVGLALDAVGFAASLVALQTLPLFVVESAIASSVGVTAALSAVVLQVRLTVAERRALTVIGVGLLALAGSASDGPAVRLEAVAPRLLLALVRPGPGWPVIAGIGFALGGSIGLASHADPVLPPLVLSRRPSLQEHSTVFDPGAWT